MSEEHIHKCSECGKVRCICGHALCWCGCAVFLSIFESSVSCSVNTQLKELKKNEPTSDNEFFRLGIISYEFHDLMTDVHKSMGNLFRSVVYSNRFKNSDTVLFKDGFKTKEQIMGEGKLALADLLTQLNMLCITFGWDFDELREMGKEHLKERQKDFQRGGWSEVKG